VVDVLVSMKVESMEPMRGAMTGRCWVELMAESSDRKWESQWVLDWVDEKVTM